MTSMAGLGEAYVFFLTAAAWCYLTLAAGVLLTSWLLRSIVAAVIATCIALPAAAVLGPPLIEPTVDRGDPDEVYWDAQAVRLAGCSVGLLAISAATLVSTSRSYGIFRQKIEQDRRRLASVLRSRAAGLEPAKASGTAKPFSTEP